MSAVCQLYVRRMSAIPKIFQYAKQLYYEATQLKANKPCHLQSDDYINSSSQLQYNRERVHHVQEATYNVPVSTLT